VAIFATGIVQNTAVSTSSVLIWNQSNQSSTTFGAYGVIPVGSVLRDVTIVNEGPNTLFVGNATGVTAVTGLGIPAGGQLTIQGYNVTSTSGGTTGNIYGICAAASSATASVGLASVASVV
jgi:hypothetical protein